MTHITTTSHKPAAGMGVLKAVFSTRWISELVAKNKASRAARAAVRDLMEYTDAELADIGLLRSDLVSDTCDDASDRWARSLLRVYR